MMTTESVQGSFQRAVSQAIQETETAFVTRWICIVETVDEHGDRGLWCVTQEGMQPWDKLGLLHYAAELAAARVAQGVADDDS